MKLRICLLALLALSVAGCASWRQAADAEPTAQELYEEAQTAGRRGEFQTAVERLEQLQARFPFGDYARQAQLDIIYMYFRAEEMDSAIVAADRYIRLYPRDPHVAYAYYMRATANMTRGHDFLTRTFRIDRSTRDPEPLRQAYADFGQLIRSYPDTEYAADARERMLTLRNQLAEYELHVARFYVRRGAYVAAAQRAQAVVDNFAETDAVGEALTIMADAYERLELEDLRREVLEKLQQRDG
jgi:outer membrane protein assembly factor BamD